MAPNVTQKRNSLRIRHFVTGLHYITSCEVVAKTARGVLLSSQPFVTTRAMGWLRSLKVKEGRGLVRQNLKGDQHLIANANAR